MKWLRCWLKCKKGKQTFGIAGVIDSKMWKQEAKKSDPVGFEGMDFKPYA